MEQYIDKSALIAEIKKLKMDIGNIFNEYDEGFWEGRVTAFDDVICSLDTLEVKEVDLEKEIKDYFDNQPIITRSKDIDYQLIPSAEVIAKHFFELGLKAQKGE